MQNRFNKRAVLSALAAASVLLAGAAQAALQDRDLNGDTVADAFYDTDLDITWLRDANVNGTIDWDTASAWADGFSLGGYDDWRLPNMGSCTINSGCTGSLEMVRLWGELGAGTGDFFTSKEIPYFAMAVHPGDIGAPIPEPESLALMLAGLTVLAIMTRRRPG